MLASGTPPPGAPALDYDPTQQQLTNPADAPTATPLFPDCACQRNVNLSPYRVYLNNMTAMDGGINQYCFKFEVVYDCPFTPLGRDNPCCYADLFKVEMPVSECRVPPSAVLVLAQQQQ